MREDYQEKLEKMFPNGYVIIYTQSNGSKRLGMFNPNKDREIHFYNKEIIAMSKD
jgi:hypothetical protein